MKNSVLDNCPPCPPAQAPPKSANFIFIVVLLYMDSYQARPMQNHKASIWILALSVAGILLPVARHLQTNITSAHCHDCNIIQRRERGEPLANDKRPKGERRTNVQQLTCNIDSSRSFYYFFFSFVLIELKPFVLKGKVLGEKI